MQVLLEVYCSRLSLTIHHNVDLELLAGGPAALAFKLSALGNRMTW
jgi:hypothetical protein